MSALTIRALEVSRGTQPVLRGANLDVNAGEIVALMGSSGAGKTTVLRAIAALQSFSGGTITLGDVELHKGSLPPQSQLGELRAKVGMVFQEHALFEHLTVLDNVTLAPIHVRRWSRGRAISAATEWLQSLGVAERLDAFPGQLSGGQAQRVSIARSLVLDPQLLLMDEPTSALDPSRRIALAETLRNLTAGGRALLISTHDVEFARACADRIATLADGIISES
ncbi:MAG TPA: ATP-binding cassette domain-containing protein [Gemmatimonadaceae bacterium]|nr:ATP-binding cassette domain-containing protein [Gemmatimonadaceae bacterium]